MPGRGSPFSFLVSTLSQSASGSQGRRTCERTLPPPRFCLSKRDVKLASVFMGLHAGENMRVPPPPTPPFMRRPVI